MIIEATFKNGARVQAVVNDVSFSVYSGTRKMDWSNYPDQTTDKLLWINPAEIVAVVRVK